MAFTHSLPFQNLLQPRRHAYRPLPPPPGFRLPFMSLRPQSFRNRTTTVPVFSFAASHEDSKPSDVEVEKEKNDLKDGAEESQEAWKETLDSFKEQALKMQSVSQEAYELYSKKAMVILKETSETLKVQAEKARQELSVIAKEISEESKEYLSNAAENSPEPVKDIVETFASSTDDLHEVSKVRDFYLGIPYGALLSVGGFVLFMFTGSVSAIRFGVILGGTLLALSISSLRSWKKGESSSIALKGQAGWYFVPCTQPCITNQRFLMCFTCKAFMYCRYLQIFQHASFALLQASYEPRHSITLGNLSFYPKVLELKENTSQRSSDIELSI